MAKWIKWLVVPVVMLAAMFLAAPRTAEAGRVVVRSYYPCYRPTVVYRYPRRVYYHAPAPVVVYRPPMVRYAPVLPPPPIPYYGVWW